MRESTHSPDPAVVTGRYTARAGSVYLSGVQALARLPMDIHRMDAARGHRSAGFISGYEGSPLAGYDLELGRQKATLDEYGIVFQPGLNEELAATAVSGSQLAETMGGAKYDGVFGIWYGKAPGLDRASDALRHANLAGASPGGGVLAVVGDDALAKSSTVPSSSELAMAELGLPTLVPADSQDILDLGLHGIAMSRYSGLWTGLKVATSVADGSTIACVALDRLDIVPPAMDFDGVEFRHAVSTNFLQPKLSELEFSLYHRRTEIARRYAAANGLNRIIGATGDAVVGIVASGAAYLELRQSLALLGLDDDDLARRGIRVLKLALIHPIEPGIVRRFAAGLHEIVVVEEKRGVIESALKTELYGFPDAPPIHGKQAPDGTTLFGPDGGLTSLRLTRGLARRLAAHDIPEALSYLRTPGPLAPRRIELPLATRTPYFCSGCPHNRSTRSAAGTLIGGGIGCSALVSLMAPERVGDVVGLTQMGGEGAGWIGLAPFITSRHFVQNIGDGTFHHSGSLAVRAAVAAGVTMTYKLLHNSAVAMTGGQQAVGAMSIGGIARSLLADGVARVLITSDEPHGYRAADLPHGVEVWDRDRLDEAQSVLAAIPGVTVLIHDQECATELRRKRKRGLVPDAPRRVLINERVCEGCGDCGAKSNCTSVRPVETEFGRKTRIHQPSCNKDLSCTDGNCPSFIAIRPAGGRQPHRTPPLAATDLPEPTNIVAGDLFAMRITGIGGTGIVTVAQVVAAAAAMSGHEVRCLDQTGLAQKGGSVVSDIRFGPGTVNRSNVIPDGQCDLYLGCDVLVAADGGYLSVASPDRTVAVVSTSEVPTGAMVTDPSVAFPSAASVSEPIRQRTSAEHGHYLDAQAATRRLFGDDQVANIFLLGVAFQLGALPLTAEAIEAALELNGVAVELNKQAFRRGRLAVADPDRAEPTNDPTPVGPSAAGTRLAGIVEAAPDSQLAALVARNCSELVAYQNERYARRYAEAVESARSAEAALVGAPVRFAHAVATSLYKLMAYKDEYEVARLSIDPLVRKQIEDEFGTDAAYSYRLHPPVLKALGMRGKISIDRRLAAPMFAVLRGARHLRGTRLDPFGYTSLRRTERALVAEFLDIVRTLCERLTEANHEQAVGIAELPDVIRGYEEVKLANVDTYRTRVDSLLEALTSPVAETS
ncbi:MAG TPA: indolepyruvate ferredoxin oxidoreductase family protein [Pseudonocardiaceae bacterium]